LRSLGFVKFRCGYQPNLYSNFIMAAFVIKTCLQDYWNFAESECSVLAPTGYWGQQLAKNSILSFASP
jgi:hypothetical protein